MKRFFVVVAILAGVVALPSCSAGPQPRVEETTQEDALLPSQRRNFSYEGKDGRTVLELLQENADEVGVIGAGANAYVTSINGVLAQESKNEYWALYVDGSPAQTGAGSLETRTGQRIEWSLETF